MTVTDEDYETDEERDEREATEAAARTGGNRDAAARRRAEKERDAEKARADAAEAALAKRDRADSLSKALADLGVDTTKGVGRLFATQYAAGDGEPTTDAVRTAILADPDLAETFGVGPDPRDAAAQEQARTATAMNGKGAPGQLTPKDVGAWDQDRQIRFMKDHPAEWDQLARNEPVNTPAGWA